MSETIHQIIDYLETKITEDLSYEDLYQSMGYSKFHLTRLFKTRTGLTISDYYLKRRLSNAASDILNTTQKIIDIAYKYNFNTDAHFSRSFKKEFRVTPRLYRNRGKFIVLTKRIIPKEGISMKYTSKEELVSDLLKCSSTEELRGFFACAENCILAKQENSQLEVVYIQYSKEGLGKQLCTLHLNMITGHSSIINIYQITNQDGPMVEMENIGFQGDDIVLDFIDHETGKTSRAKLERTHEKKINCTYGWRGR